MRILIVGDSNSGKTVLSNMIFNLLKDKHSVEIFDENGTVEAAHYHEKVKRKLEFPAKIKIEVYETRMLTQNILKSKVNDCE